MPEAEDRKSMQDPTRHIARERRGFRRTAYPSRRVEAWIALLFLVAFPVHASSQSLRGVVLADEDRSPIELAQVKLVDLETGRVLVLMADRRGSFFTEQLPGRVNRLEVSALGRLTHVDTVYALAEQDSVVVEVRLGVEAIPLDPLIVVGSRRASWQSTEPRYLWEFFERKEIYGHLGFTNRFYDRASLDTRIGKVGTLSRLETLWPAQSYQARFWADGCRTDVFLDGVRWRGGGDPLKEIPSDVDDLAGVEVYYGSSIPAEFYTERGKPCRVMAIWTQRPVFPEGDEESGPRPIIFGSLFFSILMFLAFF